MSDGGVQTICDAVMLLNGFLQKLNLAYNRFGDESVAIISDTLSHCSKLKISGNDFGLAAIHTLAGSLQNCQYLISLDLEWIKVDDESAKALSESLKACGNLEFLSLKY